MQGDFHHWVDLFNHFNTFFEKYVKTRKDLHVEDSFLESDPPFPREAVLQILRVIRIILENCTNKHLYSSYEVFFFLLKYNFCSFSACIFFEIDIFCIFLVFPDGNINSLCYTDSTPLST